MGEHICPALIPLLLIKGHRFSFRESPFPTLSSYSLFKADDLASQLNGQTCPRLGNSSYFIHSWPQRLFQGCARNPSWFSGTQDHRFCCNYKEKDLVLLGLWVVYEFWATGDYLAIRRRGPSWEWSQHERKQRWEEYRMGPGHELIQTPGSSCTWGPNWWILSFWGFRVLICTLYCFGNNLHLLSTKRYQAPC